METRVPDPFECLIMDGLHSMFHDIRERLLEDEFGDQCENIALVFSPEPDINAVLSFEKGRLTITVFRGLIEGVWATVLETLSTPEFLEGVFTSPAPARRSSTTSPLAIRSSRFEPPSDDLTEDRRMAVFDLFARVMQFIFYHEFAHAVRGHLEEVRCAIGSTAIAEQFRAHAGGVAGLKLIQLLEFDADHYALDLLVTHLDRQDPMSTWSETRAFSDHLIDSVSLLLLCQIFDADHFDNTAHYQSSHPAPVHRAMRLTGAVSRTYAREFGWSEDERIEEHDLVWRAGTIIAQILQMPEGRWHGEHTLAMDHDLFAVQEAAFLDFAKSLDARNAAFNAAQKED